VNLPPKAVYAVVTALVVVAVGYLASGHQGPAQGGSVTGQMLNDGSLCFVRVERHFADDETEGEFWLILFDPPFCSFRQGSQGSLTTGRDAIGKQVKDATSK